MATKIKETPKQFSWEAVSQKLERLREEHNKYSQMEEELQQYNELRRKELVNDMIVGTENPYFNTIIDVGQPASKPDPEEPIVKKYYNDNGTFMAPEPTELLPDFLQDNKNTQDSDSKKSNKKNSKVKKVIIDEKLIDYLINLFKNTQITPDIRDIKFISDFNNGEISFSLYLNITKYINYKNLYFYIKLTDKNYEIISSKSLLDTDNENPYRKFLSNPYDKFLNISQFCDVRIRNNIFGIIDAHRSNINNGVGELARQNFTLKKTYDPIHGSCFSFTNGNNSLALSYHTQGEFMDNYLRYAEFYLKENIIELFRNYPFIKNEKLLNIGDEILYNNEIYKLTKFFPYSPNKFEIVNDSNVVILDKKDKNFKKVKK